MVESQTILNGYDQLQWIPEREKHEHTFLKNCQSSSHFYILLVIGYAGIDDLGKDRPKHFSF